jgi:Acetyltransferase (GNAT) domain
LKLRVAFHHGQSIAAMMTIRHKSTMVYKYGCCDARYRNLGSMQMLYWKAIQDAKHSGCLTFDLGRTDADQKGLITFKNRWGAALSTLHYARYGLAEESTHSLDLSTSNFKSRAAKYVLARLPMGFFSMAGRLLYKHSG